MSIRFLALIRAKTLPIFLLYHQISSVYSSHNNNDDKYPQSIMQRGIESGQAGVPPAITLNIGGTLFQTSSQTLELADRSSILRKQKISQNSIPFFDRDPFIFRHLIAILRTGKTPQTREILTLTPALDALISEAQFYGLYGALKSALTPSPLNGLDAERKKNITLNTRDGPSAVSVGTDGSLAVAHGSKITAFDFAHQKNSIIQTSFNCIDTLVTLPGHPNVVAAGAVDLEGLHFYDLSGGLCTGLVKWKIPDVDLHAPTVQAAAAGPGSQVFAAFESSRKNANTVLVIDSQNLQVCSEFGRHLGGGENLETPTKLEWIDNHGLLFASCVIGGVYGHKSILRVYDVRAAKEVCQFQESTVSRGMGDCFGDVAWCEELGKVVKVDMRSGLPFMADLRNLQDWVCCGEDFQDERGSNAAKISILVNGKQVLSARGSDLEVWCEVGQGFRRSVFPSVSDERIVKFAVGGNRLYVLRKNLHGIEVWESGTVRDGWNL